MQAQMLAPAAVLVVWSLIIMYAIIPRRFGAIGKMDKASLPQGQGLRGQDLEAVLPPKANWPAHNFSHLMEQPTVFYPAVVIMAVMGASNFDVLLAWIYVGMRIIHSIWQIAVNEVRVRFLLFLVSSIALTILAIRAVMATLFFDPGALPV